MLNNMWSKGSGKMEGIPSLNDDTVSNPFWQKMSKTDSETKKDYANIHPSKSIDGDTIK